MSKLPKASFQITQKIWQSGRMRNWEDATTHVLSHGLHYGSGVFEGIRFYETPDGKPAIFRLREHVKRFFYSANAIGMRIPFSQKEIADAIVETVRVNKIKSGYIRPLAFFGYGKMGLNPTAAPVEVVIACWPWGSYLGGKPIAVKISKFIRIHPESLIPDAKVAGHYVNSILASREVEGTKFDEALFLDHRGRLAEGPGENLFFVKKGVLHTPELGSILAGITRESILTIAKDFGWKAKIGHFLPKSLREADEAFFCGTAAEVTSIGSLDGKKIGDGKEGKFTQKIRETYLAACAAEIPKYKKWTTIVGK